MVSYKEEYEQIKAMHDHYPMLVGRDLIWTRLLPGVVISVASITVVFVFVSLAVRHLSPKCGDKVVYRSAYNATNLVVNSFLGLIGLYYHYYVIDRTLPREMRVLGYEEVFPMICIQFGCNLWAIPVGLTLVDETPTMLGHHVAVLFVTSVSALFTTGHRWYVPFMYGVLELSSIPLAIMNAFKDNPEYIKKYPSAYLCIRIMFAATFLFIRWYLYLPLKYDFLRTFAYTAISHHSAVAVFFNAMTWLASFFLSLLQLLWGFLIIKGIVKFATGEPKEVNKKDT